MTRGRLALTALGIALSTLAIVAMLHAVKAADVWVHLRATRVGWLLAGMGVTILGYVFRAYRWRALLSPQREIPIGRVFGPTVVGFLAINTLPARIGEFVRAYLLARLERLPAAAVLGSCVLERVIDLVLLASVWVMLLFVAPLPEQRLCCLPASERRDRPARRENREAEQCAAEEFRARQALA